RAKIVFVEDNLIEQLPSKSETYLQKIVSFGSKLEDSIDKIDSNDLFDTVYRSPNNPASIIYTSGTTGEPKGVVLSHGNVISNSYAAIHHTRISPNDRLICFLPLFHSFAQNFIANSAINCGATLVLHKKYEQDDILELTKQHKVTRFYAVPTIYIMLLNTPGIKEYLKSLTYSFSAASSLPVEVIKEWKEQTGMNINEAYGLTESSPFATYNHEFRHKAGSVGTSIENVEIRIADKNDNPLKVGEEGEILIQGPNVMLGYFGKQKETEETLKNGWLHTGDVGKLDDEGYLYIVDRTKDMINSGGENISPREVEETLYQNDCVQECSVVGMPDKIYQESVLAYVVLKEGKMAEEAELIEFCKSRMARFKAPKKIKFAEALPKNATGKILKRKLREMAKKEFSK
ncbi:MAG: long-chain fatty acid--CoA ligase, partial [Epsilonproteobacteria bacterium]|nr:long-chain fatty acid--CoA ligase [Campylobacterota bacterium]